MFTQFCFVFLNQFLEAGVMAHIDFVHQPPQLHYVAISVCLSSDHLCAVIVVFLHERSFQTGDLQRR
jgi:hypothetical protein